MRIRLALAILLFAGIATKLHAQTQINLATQVRGNLGVTHLNSGTAASNTTFWRGDGVWATPSGGSGCTLQGGTNLLLYDTSTACNDITKWQTNGTTTITGLATAILDLSAAATFKTPASAAFAPTTANFWGYDSTNNRPVLGNGTNTSFLNWITSAPTTNDCTKFTGTLGQLADNGGPCPITLGTVAHQFLTSYTSTSGLFTQAQPLAADIGSIPGSSGQLLFNNAGAIGAEDPVISYSTPAETTAAWTSATANNTNIKINLQATSTSTFSTIVVTLNQGTTITGGAVQFFVSDTTAMTNLYAPNICWQPSTGLLVNAYTLTASTNQVFICNVAGFQGFEINLSPAIIGSATVNVGLQPSAAPVNPAVTAIQATGSNLHVQVDTAPTTTITGTVTATCTAANCAVNLAQEAGTAITNVPTAIGTLGSGNVISVNGDLTSEHGTAITNVPTAIGTLGTGNVISVNQDATSQHGTAITTVPVAFGSGTPSGNAPGENAALFVGTTAVRTNQTTTAAGTVDTNTTGIAGTTVVTDGTAGVQAVGGHKADNGVAAGTDRVPTLPCIYQTSYLNGTAATQGRNGAASCGDDGLLWTAVLPAMRPASYTASANFAGSSTTLAMHLAGNATNTVLVTGIRFSCTATTAGIPASLTITKTSAASTGGTAATMTAVPDDSNYAAASSVAQSFTGTGPTAGTPVGQIDAYKLDCNALATAGPNDIYISPSWWKQKPIVLRGTAQTLEVSFGAAVTGGNYSGTFEWIETSTITP